MPPPHFVPRPMLSNFPTPTSTFAPYRTGQNLVSPTTSSMLQEIISPAAEGHPHGPKLPPLQMNGMSEVRQRPSTQRYNVEPVVATKRTHSPNTYSQHTALKDRGRPVSLAAYSARTFAPCDNDTIEPDDGDEDDDLNLLTGDLKFSRRQWHSERSYGPARIALATIDATIEIIVLTAEQTGTPFRLHKFVYCSASLS